MTDTLKPCRGCGQPVLWAKTPAGKAIPLDPGQASAGTIVLENGIAYVLRVGDPRFAEWMSRPAHERYKSHFASCSRAADFRKAS